MNMAALFAKQSSSGKSLPPPVYHLAATADLREGDHYHDVWRGRVVHHAMPGQSMPMMVKAVDSQVTLAVEVACALAARELKLPVPQPGLVIAERDFLPGIRDKPRDKPRGKVLLLAGSHYQRPDALFAEVMAGNPAGEELIWQKICATPAAREGAAFDELIANPDRHCENVLFDGMSWWLFDHDQALAPAGSFVKQSEAVAARQAAIEFTAEANELVWQLVHRFSDKHGILDQVRKMNRGGGRLHSLARYSRGWTHADPAIRDTLELIGLVLGLIHLRLPALAEKLNLRLGTPPPKDSLWSTPSALNN